ncbi:MAG: hypothetical protein AMK72_05805 [Planctomycetes bacterium SM23_25]|nr:MAG: hypothetical protein AMK72_05805 [Planctomycetes bacterium SM23_25]
MEPVRVHITTYGCQMNRLDAELVAQRLRTSGARVVDDSAGANVLLFVTCSVRAHAENRVFSNIGALAARKRRQPDLVIGLLGCMAQQYGGRIRSRVPLVDVVCAPGRLAELPDLIEAARTKQASPVVALDPPRDADAFAAADAALDEVETCRPLGGPSPGHAFVTVMRGCDNFCAYCVVPNVRGPERSRPPGVVLEEVRRLVGQGARQITLLGQAVNKYAGREGARTWDLADLIEKVAETPNLARLAFITSHPRAMTERLIRVFRDVPAVCPYLHMPAQSGSDAVLARMNRGYTHRQYADRVAMVRASRPEVAVASDFIVGFPGETPRDFEATMDLVRRMRFSQVFVFKYSPRPGTFAAEHYADDVPMSEKRRRNQALLDLVQEICGEDNRRFVGRRMTVFVEGPSPRAGKDPGPFPQLRGRTPGNRIVVFDGPAGLAGTEVDVEVTDSSPLTLFARLAEAVCPGGA